MRKKLEHDRSQHGILITWSWVEGVYVYAVRICIGNLMLLGFRWRNSDQFVLADDTDKLPKINRTLWTWNGSEFAPALEVSCVVVTLTVLRPTFHAWSWFADYYSLSNGRICIYMLAGLYTENMVMLLRWVCEVLKYAITFSGNCRFINLLFLVLMCSRHSS